MAKTDWVRRCAMEEKRIKEKRIKAALAQTQIVWEDQGRNWEMGRRATSGQYSA